ncbi:MULTISPECIES: hypothetical protein [Henriciella]|jgi:hypothetical protein|nr:hypothetical protein [Henriciella pelagia]
MMKVLSSLSILLLSGCATVSMVSKEAIVETSLASEQSALRESATTFKVNAEAEGWVSESKGLADFANILFGGASEQTDRAPASYGDKIGAGDLAVEEVFRTIETDARQAATSLQQLDLLAEELLLTGKVSRADVISFESALVVAQKSYRSFSEAAGIAGARGNTGLTGAELALVHFASSIDAARLSADQLASAYASGSQGVTASS